ncbi:TPA: GNAT family N-acetyltransferase, partial [Legionella pneumophila]
MNIKELQSALKIETATLDDYPIIQNMARFYVYELSRDCGFISEDWALPPDGLYESFDFKKYFEEPTRKAFLIKVGNELAGFALLNQEGIYPDTMWNMGEFFITAKFQGKGLGFLVSSELWNMHPGLWEISVIPENKPALNFWRKTIAKITMGNFQEEIKTVNYDPHQPQRVIFRFDSNVQNVGEPLESKKEYQIQFVDELDETTENRMTKGFVAYEAQHGIDVNYRCFSVTISSAQGEVFGVINAYTAFSEIYVDDIWVDSAYRG